MLPILSIEVLIVSKPIVWDLKMVMSFILFEGLNCKFVSRRIKKESLIEMFGFEINSNSELVEVLSFCEFYNIDIIKTSVGEYCPRIVKYRYISRFKWVTVLLF